MNATATIFGTRAHQYVRFTLVRACCTAAAAARLVAGAGCAASDGGGQPPNDGGGSGGSGSGGATPGTGGSASGSGGSRAGTGGSGSGGSGTGGSIVPTDGGGSGGSDGGASDGKPRSTLGPAGFTCPAGASGNPLPSANPTATLIKGGFPELEGPAWVASQKTLFFVQMGGQINKYTPADGMFSVVAPGVMVGGLALDPDGMLVAAAYDVKAVVRYDPTTGKRTAVPGGANFNGKAFNEVNDVVVRGDGNIYFSDPNFGTPSLSAFYRLSPPPESKVTLIMQVNLANGLAISPDGAWLYLASSGGGPPLRRMALAADGSVMGAGTAWKETYSDGMAGDCAGKLYLSDASGSSVVYANTPAPLSR